MFIKTNKQLLMSKKRNWKFWTSRILLTLFVIGCLWLTNLIWFKPFSINHFYEKVFIQVVVQSPEATTGLGIPILYNWYKDELDDISDTKLQSSFKKFKEDYKTLLSYDFESQSKENQLNTKVLTYFMKMNSVDGEPYFYHGYPVNQMRGVQSSLPSMMMSSHKLNDESDIEAYISRLSKFGVKFNQLIENLKIRESKGIIPPKFIITKVLDEMKGFIAVKKDSLSVSTDELTAVNSNPLYIDFEKRVALIEHITSEEKEAYQQQVEKAIEASVFPAYEKLINYFEQLYLIASNDAGVWKFPNGDAYYRYKLKENTTTDLSPEEIHNIGLKEVSRIKKEMYDILESEGIVTDTTKTLGDIIPQLNKEERFLYPNNDEGREMILADYKKILSEIENGLDNAFDMRPKASLDVKRVPEFKEEGTSMAYYKRPALDGSRGGVFYANLSDLNTCPKYGMKSLAYHEGIPGHHFQRGIQQELKGVPTFRKILPFTAYAEGWALYTEQLAWELGFYENDPFGNLGRLQHEIRRAVRLVVDTGIHSKKWTREEAIDYMVENTGLSKATVVTQIERYIVMPGQACSYKIGMIKILALRAKAKKELGDKFSLIEFHNAVLKNGAVPLDILEEIIDTYIAKTLKDGEN